MWEKPAGRIWMEAQMDSGADRATLAAFSRRSLLSLLALSPLILASCRSLGPADAPPARFAEAQIDRVMDGYNALARSDRTLPGIQSLAQFNEQLAEGLNPADLSLVAAALYLRAREQVVRIRRPITITDVRTALSRPIDMAPYGRSFLEQTLAEARAREATDPVYRGELQNSRRSCLTRHTPLGICIGMIVVLILILILVDGSDLPDQWNPGHARPALRS
jgi:hypothetical protein